MPDDCPSGYSFSATATDRPATVEFADLSPETSEAFEQAVVEGDSGFVPS